MWMNEGDIETLFQNQHACPNVRKAVKLLHALMVAVNAQSDGWAYWQAPSRAAGPLMALLQDRSGNLWYDTTGSITPAELAQVVKPIKAMVTRQKRVQAEHGNTFDFDVEGALA